MQRAKPKKFSLFSRAIAKLAEAKEKKIAITSFSLAARDRTEIAFTDTTYFQKPEGKKELEILYRNSWACFKAINVRANLLSARGLKIVTKDDKAKKVVSELIMRMHTTSPMLALQNTFRERSINTDVFGNGYDELLYMPAGTKDKPIPVSQATDLLGFTAMHPMNTDFIRKDMSDYIEVDNTGTPVGYNYQTDPSGNTTTGIKLELDRVGHLKYNVIGDELLGISTLEPVYKTAERLLKIEEGITQGIMTHGNPLHDVIVGDESHPPDKKMIDNTAAEVAGLNMKSEYVHPPWIRVGQIESFSLGKAASYMQPYITAIAAGTGVPEFILLGRGEGTNKATAQAMVNFIHQTIEPLQQKQAMYFEDKILAPLMRLHKIEEVPKVEWNEILPKNPNDYSQIVKVLSDAMIDGKHVVTREEVREIAGLTSETSFKTGNNTLSKKESK